MPDPLTPPEVELDLGHVREGVVELDPMTGHMVIRSETPTGFDFFDVQGALTKYVGQEVRVIIVPCSTIEKVSDLVNSGTLPLDQVPTAQRS
jgi:hypothetical protein